MGLTAPLVSARSAALSALVRILDKGQTLDEAMVQVVRGLSDEDRRFCRAIVLASLRHKGSIEHLITRYLSRPLPKSGRLAHLLLVSGAAQLLFVGTPAHAVVNEQVSLLPENSKFRGVVNAVLRRFDRDGRERILDPKVRQRDLPEWLWHRWKAAYGAEPTMAVIQALGRDDIPLDVTVREDAPGWADKLGGTALGGSTVRLNSAAGLTAMPGFSEGAWWVQDLAAALPALLLGKVTGQRILDACAAPGGKTAQLSAGGGLVTALDRSEKRMRRLTHNLKRLGLYAEVAVADLRTYEPDAPFDAVLLDAPCTATGTLRRHPDIGWKRSGEDVASLARLQAEMLAVADRLVRPGGALVYCTCSMEPEEGELQIERFLAASGNFRRDRIRPEEVGLGRQMINGNGELRTMPSHFSDEGGMDGFFAARLIRQ